MILLRANNNTIRLKLPAYCGCVLEEIEEKLGIDKEKNMIYNELKEKWWSASSSFKLSLEKTNYLQKKKKEKQFDLIIDKASEYIKSMPKDEDKRVQWENEGEALLNEFIEKEPIFKLEYLDANLRDGISKRLKIL